MFRNTSIIETAKISYHSLLDQTSKTWFKFFKIKPIKISTLKHQQCIFFIRLEYFLFCSISMFFVGWWWLQYKMLESGLERKGPRHVIQQTNLRKFYYMTITSWYNMKLLCHSSLIFDPLSYNWIASFIIQKGVLLSLHHLNE